MSENLCLLQGVVVILMVNHACEPLIEQSPVLMGRIMLLLHYESFKEKFLPKKKDYNRNP